MDSRLLLFFLVAAGSFVPQKCQILPSGYPCEVIGSTQPANVTNCEKKLDCNSHAHARYRTIDGTCNNVDGNPEWGSTKVPFARLISRNPLLAEGYPPKFRYRRNNRALTNAREISNKIHSGADGHFSNITTMVMQFGQFLDHDITLTPEMNLCALPEDSEGGECAEEEVNCCDFIGRQETPKSCYPINIPRTDPFFRAIFPSPTCLDFKRSQPFPCNYSNQAPNERREQFNVLTSFVDGSQIYGSDEELALDLRQLVDGLMKVSDGGLLPTEGGTCPHSKANFFGGDVRVNENPGLQSLHTVWIREHNRLARHFKAVDPSLDDEQIYQEARRLVIGQLQNIVYSEFLPIILGPKHMYDYELDLPKPHDDGTPRRSMYRSSVNPNVMNSFATAAFRFGHSLISGPVSLRSNDTEEKEKTTNLKDNFFNTRLVREGNMNKLLRGMCWQDAELGNNVISDEVRNFLFRRPGEKFGMDLAARNIQRGRDHELASYDSYRSACGMRIMPKTFFSMAPSELPHQMWRKFDDVYHKPEDIELFPGGMSEKPVEGGIIGPTFACIIAEQFKRLKFGDRHFFTHSNSPREARFCKEDLTALRKRTLRDVICDTNDFKAIPTNPFRSVGNREKPIPCKERNKLEPSKVCVAKSNEADNYIKDVGQLGDNDSSVGEVAVIAGGYNGWQILDSVELFSPNETCQQRLTPLPNQALGLILFYIKGDLLACGGRTVQGYASQTCYLYMRDSAKGSWMDDAKLKLKQPRYDSAGVEVHGIYFITGGRSSPQSTEHLDPSVGSWVEGPRLLSPRSRHSMVAYQDSFIVLGGGHRGTEIEFYNCTSGERRALPNLLGYRAAHSSVLLPNTNSILSFGGFSFTSSIYSLDLGKDMFGARSNVPRHFGAGIVLNDRVFAFGGDSYTNLAEEYDVETNKFIQLTSRLLEGKSSFGVTKVPAVMFAHLPGGCKP